MNMLLAPLTVEAVLHAGMAGEDGAHRKLHWRRHCSDRCPYQLDTPNLLKYMLKDYREFYETHKDEL